MTITTQEVLGTLAVAATALFGVFTFSQILGPYESTPAERAAGKARRKQQEYIAAQVVKEMGLHPALSYEAAEQRVHKRLNRELADFLKEHDAL